MFALLFRMGVGADRRGEADLSGRRGPRSQSQRAFDAYDNQFQLALLFLALAPLAILTRKDDIIFVVLAWVFVILRLVHAALVMSANSRGRFQTFATAAFVLALMWIVFAIQILSGL
jgi:hypothetical protein